MTATPKDDGGAAFPELTYIGDEICSVKPGLSVRDYFAGQALSGMPSCFQDMKNVNTVADRARVAYAHADAMLAERAK